MTTISPRSTLGAQLVAPGQTSFRVWAPSRKQVDLLLETPGGLVTAPMRREPDGTFVVQAPASAGSRYRYKLDGGEAFPDPVSRFQPDGPHGPSMVVDPSAYRWRDATWKGARLEGQVIYELHVGTFTPEGTYEGVRQKLPYLKDLGITMIELMPLNTFPGRFNWGYDGVNLFAPCAVYGTPEDLKRLIDEAHGMGLSMILDVVYNHIGPDGNYLPQYSKDYFTDRYPNEWGQCLNFDGAKSAHVRAFFVQNACEWIATYHFDGLRMDATQSLHDASETHIVKEIVQAAREAAGGRSIVLIAENEPQDEQYVRPIDSGGYGADAIWVDDFHHTARVALTGKSEAYLAEYRGSAQELLSCARHNSLYQGQYYGWQQKRRGNCLLHVPANQMVFFLQNHDQVSNHIFGTRPQLLSGEPKMRALTTYLLLLPQTPLLFQGQEFFSTRPFVFFTDFGEALQSLVKQGRSQFLAQFKSAELVLREEGNGPPFGQQAFEASRLDWAEKDRHAPALLMHRTLLRLRREDPVFAAQDRGRLDGAVLSEDCLALRFFGGPAGDRLLLLNLGADLPFSPCPSPLLGEEKGHPWQLLLSSEDSRFGGQGSAPFLNDDRWLIPGHCALLLTSEQDAERRP